MVKIGDSKQERTIIHVYMMETGQNYYFGSVAAIYSMFSAEELGISYNTLKNIGVTLERNFYNSKCKISRGILVTKSTSPKLIQEIKEYRRWFADTNEDIPEIENLEEPEHIRNGTTDPD